MPHFGLIPEDELSEDEILLLRSKLHIRSGLRRMREEKYSAGIATLYDALVSAMQWYILFYKLKKYPEEFNMLISDDVNLFDYLSRREIIKSSFDFRKFQELMNKGLDISLTKTDINFEMLDLLEVVLTQLTIIPFNQADLPQENPATY